MKVIIGTRQPGGHLTSQVGSDIWDFSGERNPGRAYVASKCITVSVVKLSDRSQSLIFFY